MAGSDDFRSKNIIGFYIEAFFVVSLASEYWHTLHEATVQNFNHLSGSIRDLKVGLVKDKGSMKVIQYSKNVTPS